MSAPSVPLPAWLPSTTTCRVAAYRSPHAQACILITGTNIKSGAGNEVELTATYTVSVYATKPGYENSEVVTKEISVDGGIGMRRLFLWF